MPCQGRGLYYKPFLHDLNAQLGHLLYVLGLLCFVFFFCGRQCIVSWWLSCWSLWRCFCIVQDFFYLSHFLVETLWWWLLLIQPRSQPCGVHSWHQHFQWNGNNWILSASFFRERSSTTWDWVTVVVVNLSCSGASNTQTGLSVVPFSAFMALDSLGGRV